MAGQGLDPYAGMKKADGTAGYRWRDDRSLPDRSFAAPSRVRGSPEYKAFPGDRCAVTLCALHCARPSAVPSS